VGDVERAAEAELLEVPLREARAQPRLREPLAREFEHHVGAVEAGDVEAAPRHLGDQPPAPARRLQQPRPRAPPLQPPEPLERLLDEVAFLLRVLLEDDVVVEGRRVPVDRFVFGHEGAGR
jgi:hypothetical protein